MFFHIIKLNVYIINFFSKNKNIEINIQFTPFPIANLQNVCNKSKFKIYINKIIKSFLPIFSKNHYFCNA